MENDNQTSTAKNELLYEGIPEDDKEFPSIKIIEMVVDGEMDF